MADKTPRRRRDDLPEEANVVRKNDSDNRYYNRDRKGSNWAWITLFLILVLLLAGWYFVERYGNEININNTNQNLEEQNQGNENKRFTDERRTSNFQNSIPKQAETIPAPPVAIVIQTSTVSSAQNTNITINKDNRDYGVGDTVVGTNGNTLRRNVSAEAPDGVYTVNYKTCGINGQCQDGSYQFEINRKMKAGFEDQRNKAEVMIVLANDKLYPERVVVSKNTKVILKNETSNQAVLAPGTEGVRNYFANLSGNVAADSTFTYTFAQEGYYPFNVTIDNRTIEGRMVVQ